MMIGRKPGLHYVNRAEQSAYDFTESTLTADSAWHTLSLSGIVPANAKLVVLRIGAARSVGGQYFRVGKVGVTGSYNVANVATQVANIISEQTTIVELSSQSIQYWLTTGTWASVRLLVLGWFL